MDRWFKTILNNALRLHKNNEKGYSAAEYIEEESEGMPSSQFEDRIVEEIYELIDTKSVMQIEVLTLYFRHGYTAKDIEHITEYPYWSTMKTIQRFREELKELYK